jgi:hypothetical protein
MFELIFFAVVSVGFLAAFFLLGAKRPSAPSAKVPALDDVGQDVGKMIRLKGLSFGNSARMLDDSDYRTLAANPRLRSVADQFRSERQKLILQWLSALLCDLNSLWRFRRMLVRHGAPVRAGEEFKIFKTFVSCLALLFALKLSVRVAGPFVVGSLVRKAVGFVAKMSDVTSSTLARVPSSVWPEIERNWAAQAA